VGGFAAHTPKNSTLFPLGTGEPFLLAGMAAPVIIALLENLLDWC